MTKNKMFRLLGASGAAALMLVACGKDKNPNVSTFQAQEKGGQLSGKQQLPTQGPVQGKAQQSQGKQAPLPLQEKGKQGPVGQAPVQGKVQQQQLPVQGKAPQIQGKQQLPIPAGPSQGKVAQQQAPSPMQGKGAPVQGKGGELGGKSVPSKNPGVSPQPAPSEAPAAVSSEPEASHGHAH